MSASPDHLGILARSRLLVVSVGGIKQLVSGPKNLGFAWV